MGDPRKPPLKGTGRSQHRAQIQHRVQMWSRAGAGGRRGPYLFVNVLIVVKKLLKDHRRVPGVVLVIDAAAV